MNQKTKEDAWERLYQALREHYGEVLEVSKQQVGNEKTMQLRLLGTNETIKKKTRPIDDKGRGDSIESGKISYRNARSAKRI